MPYIYDYIGIRTHNNIVTELAFRKYCQSFEGNSRDSELYKIPNDITTSVFFDVALEYM